MTWKQSTSTFDFMVCACWHICRGVQINLVCLIVITPWDWQDWGLILEALPRVMKRFLGYWSPLELRNPPPPTTEQIKATLVFLKNKEGKKRKPDLPRKVKDTLTVFCVWELSNLTMNLLTPTTGVLLAGILTSSYSSGSVPHEQDNLHAHGNYNDDRAVKERGR